MTAVTQALRRTRDHARTALRRVGIRTVRLDVDEMIAAARRRTGLHDLGEDAFLRGSLRALLASYDREVPMVPAAVRAYRKHLVQRLVTRLRIEAHLAAHPEVLDRPVERPVVVTCLPRCGSTFLHRLLAADPASRAPRLWEMFDPVPPPEEATYESDPRIARLAAILESDASRSAERQKMHYVGAQVPEECLALFANEGYFPGAVVDLTAYGTWLDGQDLRAPYRGHKRQLQLLQSRFMRARWLLKAPAHLYALEGLVGVYPDVQLVWLHRDPLRVVPSLAKLASASGRAEERLRPYTPAEVGRRTLRSLSLRLERALAARERLEARGVRFVDVFYDDLVADPAGTAAALYERLELPRTESAEAAWRAYAEANPRHKRGAYRYSLEEFGLTAADVRRVLGAYAARFGLWS